jgi:hypothetical protein
MNEVIKLTGVRGMDFYGGEVQAQDESGKRFSLSLQPADVHDPTELPTYLAGYSPFQYRADEMSKVILMDNYQDKIRTFSDNDAFEAVPVKGSPMGSVPEVDPSSSLQTITAVDRFIGSFVPKQTELQTGNNYQPIMAATRRCKRAIDLDREIDVTTLIDTAANFDASVRVALGAGQNWNGGAGSDPILDIQTAIEASWQTVSEIWMNQQVAFAFLRHDSTKDYMRQMLGDSAPSGALGQVASAGQGNVDFTIPGFPPFRVAAAKVNTAGVLVPCLGDVVTLLTTPPGTPTDGEEIATTYTFRVRGPSGVGYSVREYFVQGRGPEGGTMIVVAMADIAVMTSDKAGAIITGVIT